MTDEHKHVFTEYDTGNVVPCPCGLTANKYITQLKAALAEAEARAEDLVQKLATERADRRYELAEMEEWGNAQKDDAVRLVAQLAQARAALEAYVAKHDEDMSTASRDVIFCQCDLCDAARAVLAEGKAQG